MGLQAETSLDLTYDNLASYLRTYTRVFMKCGEKTYYLTHTDGYWRAQDCAVLNDKGHFTDCSELCDTVSDFLRLAWVDGKRIEEVFDDCTFYGSIQEGWEA